MKSFLAYITVIILFVVQTTLGRYIDIYGIAPNLVFVFAVCYSMYNFPVRSAVLCVVSGLILDLYNCTNIGLNALLYMYIGLAVSMFFAVLMKKSLFTVALGVITVSAVYQIIWLVLVHVINHRAPFLYSLVRIVLPSTVYDGIAATVMYMWARWLSEEQIRGL